MKRHGTEHQSWRRSITEFRAMRLIPLFALGSRHALQIAKEGSRGQRKCVHRFRRGRPRDRLRLCRPHGSARQPRGIRICVVMLIPAVAQAARKIVGEIHQHDDFVISLPTVRRLGERQHHQSFAIRRQMELVPNIQCGRRQFQLYSRLLRHEHASSH